MTAARLAGSPRTEGIAAANVGLAQLDQGQLDAAAESFAQARRAFELVDDRFHLARLATHEGALDAARGNPGAERALLAALEAVIALDDFEGELCAREALVRVCDGTLALRRLEALEALVEFAEDVGWRRRSARLRGDRPSGAPPAEGPTRLRGSDLALELTRDGRSVELRGEAFDFSRRGPLRRVLLALVDARLAAPGRALSTAEVQAAGWPGEVMMPESGAARVYMAIRRLRELGLEPVLWTRDDGYALDPQLEVRWVP